MFPKQLSEGRNKNEKTIGNSIIHGIGIYIIYRLYCIRV